MNAITLTESLSLQPTARPDDVPGEAACAPRPQDPPARAAAPAPLYLGYPAGVLQHAGEAHGAFVQQVLKLRRDAQGDQARLLVAALAQAAEAGCLGPQELRGLQALATVPAMADAAARLARCREVQQQLMRLGAAPLAMTIAAIACDSAAAALQQALPIGEDILGAVVGGILGAAFGNPFIGAVVGAALLSSAAFNPVR